MRRVPFRPTVGRNLYLCQTHSTSVAWVGTWHHPFLQSGWNGFPKINRYMTGTPQSEKYNHLQNETSPYLLRHCHNPVEWWPYGQDALKLADEEDKILFLSIGYTHSYGCHAMNTHCFEDEDVAAALNKDFVCVKIDKDEMPELTAYYMRVAHGLGVGTGWPLTVFASEHQRPFFAGSYFPKKEFLTLLHKIKHLWRHSRLEVDALAKQIHDHTSDNIDICPPRRFFSKNASVVELFRYAKKVHDQHYPRSDAEPPDLETPTRYRAGVRLVAGLTNASYYADFDSSFNKLLSKGAYDHLGGGFYNYSYDVRWPLPHNKDFEKTLYDNALLAEAFVEYHQATQEGTWGSVTRSILDYVLENLENTTQGGYFASEDGDSNQQREGKYYLWHFQQIRDVLTKEETEKLSTLYGITELGNFRKSGLNHFELQKGFSWADKQDPIIQSAHRKLLAERNKRIRPLKDERIFTSYNGMMIQAMAKSYRVLAEKEYLLSAQKAAAFVRTNLWEGSTGLLRRCYAKGESKHEATLEDYAFLISGLIELYQADFSPSWLDWAITLQQDQDNLFWDYAGKGYFLTRHSPTLPVPLQVKEKLDGMYPSGNSAAVYNNLRLWEYTRNERYRQRAYDSLRLMQGSIQDASLVDSIFSDTNSQGDTPPCHVAIMYPRSETAASVTPFLDAMRRVYAPDTLVAVAAEGSEHQRMLPMLQDKECIDNRATAYVLQTGSQFATVTVVEPEELMARIRPVPSTAALEAFAGLDKPGTSSPLLVNAS